MMASWETSSKFHATNFQNERSVRDLLHFSHFEAEHVRFPASFSSKAILTKLKLYVFFETPHEIGECTSTQYCACHEKRRDKSDTLLKYCACHAKRKRYLLACKKNHKFTLFARKSTSSTSSLSHFVRAGVA